MPVQHLNALFIPSLTILRFVYTVWEPKVLTCALVCEYTVISEPTHWARFVTTHSTAFVRALAAQET